MCFHRRLPETCPDFEERIIVKKFFAAAVCFFVLFGTVGASPAAEHELVIKISLSFLSLI
jgi:hypothetical protein